MSDYSSKLIKITSGVGTSLLAYKGISQYIFDSIFKRKDKAFVPNLKYQNWINNSNTKQVEIKSFDGLLLDAMSINNHDNNKYLILVHGIWSDKEYMYPYAYEFDKLGYNLLIIDQRACGNSQGKYCTYGFKESLDLLQWIDYLIKYDVNAQIALFGASMGATTVMMSLAHHLPVNVKCVIEDCGYSNLKQELSYVFKNKYHIALPELLLSFVEKQMIDKFGIDFSDISAEKCLDNNVIPILFIHGKEDDLVPFEMSKVLYNHNKGYKKIYPISFRNHCECHKQEKYYSNIDSFINNFMDNN